ncbi:hypothetical protein [Gluconobacter albidus]|uniref:hypothetical protein n=1 Tax=Gluconobacter albidus TaxID=318683 RepID=UPI000A97B5EB|nr:hypothetical protein [Gluconobacter albidus]
MSKIHAPCDSQGRTPGFVLTAGQLSNNKAMLADRGNDSDSRRQDLLIHGILPVIPSRKGRGAPSKQTGKAIGTALGPL